MWLRRVSLATLSANSAQLLPNGGGPPVAITRGMLLVYLPYLSSVVPPVEDRSAQVQLADLLADADSIDSVHVDAHHFTFAIERGDTPFEIVATTDRSGVVIDVVSRERMAADFSLGNLSWLADTMKQTTAVTRLAVDEDGAVLLTTSDGMRYMAIPGRGSGGNDEVEARWAADHS
jgi:hypothetical protein